MFIWFKNYIFFCIENLPDHLVYGSIYTSEQGCLILNKLVVGIRILVLELGLKFRVPYFDEKQVSIVFPCSFSLIEYGLRFHEVSPLFFCNLLSPLSVVLPWSIFLN